MAQNPSEDIDSIKQKTQIQQHLIQLDGDVEQLAQILHRDVIQPHLDEIVECFYKQLLQNDKFKALVDNGFNIDKLKASQTRYLLSFGVDINSDSYYQERLKIGLSHAKHNICSSLFLSAQCLLQQLLIARIPRNHPDERDLINLVLQIFTLDYCIAAESFHHTALKSMERSLDSLGQERLALKRVANMDNLTNMMRREAFIELLDKTLAPEQNSGQIYILMADMDHFERINETYGHIIGDHVLKGVASRIKAALRKEVQVGRYGGERFSMLVKTKKLSLAIKIAERIRKRIEQEPIKAGMKQIPVTISFGVASACKNDDSEALLKRADEALRLAKHSGRNRVETIGAGSADVSHALVLEPHFSSHKAS